MSRTPLTILRLVCRKCGGALPAVGEDCVFVCPVCATAWEPEASGAARFQPLKVEVTAARKPSEGAPVLLLPFWWFPVRMQLEGPPKRVAEAPRLEGVWVSAYTARGATITGNPAVQFTRYRLRHEAEPLEERPLVGADRGRATAACMVPFVALQAIDFHIDVTGMSLEVEAGDPILVGVPFAVREPQLIDLLAEHRYQFRHVAHLGDILGFHYGPSAPPDEFANGNST